MQTGVQQVALFPDSHLLTIVCADDPEPQRLFVLGSLDDKHRLKPQLILGITPPDAPCIHKIIHAVLTADADLYARAFDAQSVINNCNYDSITPGTSIHSGNAHDSIIEKGTTFFRNTFANYLHWSSGGRFVCSVRLMRGALLAATSALLAPVALSHNSIENTTHKSTHIALTNVCTSTHKNIRVSTRKCTRTGIHESIHKSTHKTLNGSTICVRVIAKDKTRQLEN